MTPLLYILVIQNQPIINGPPSSTWQTGSQPHCTQPPHSLPITKYRPIMTLALIYSFLKHLVYMCPLRRKLLLPRDKATTALPHTAPPDFRTAWQTSCRRDLDDLRGFISLRTDLRPPPIQDLNQDLNFITMTHHCMGKGSCLEQDEDHTYHGETLQDEYCVFECSLQACDNCSRLLPEWLAKIRSDGAGGSWCNKCDFYAFCKKQGPYNKSTN